jgi:hypothetical protein
MHPEKSGSVVPISVGFITISVGGNLVTLGTVFVEIGVENEAGVDATVFVETEQEARKKTAINEITFFNCPPCRTNHFTKHIIQLYIEEAF